MKITKITKKDLKKIYCEFKPDKLAEVLESLSEKMIKWLMRDYLLLLTPQELKKMNKTQIIDYILYKQKQDRAIFHLGF